MRPGAGESAPPDLSFIRDGDSMASCDSNSTLLGRVWANAGLDDAAWRRTVCRWGAVSLLLIAVAAYNSYGFFQFDEHYQVVEFAGYKLGKAPASDMPWEFRSQIRPWLQPGMYYLAARTLIAVGVENPFYLTGAFRMISGAIGWLAIVSLMLSANVLLQGGWAAGTKWQLEAPSAGGAPSAFFADSRRLVVMLLATLWLLPYLAVRTSSESLSSDFFTLGVATLILTSFEMSDAPGQSSTRRISLIGSLIAGCSFGLAFEFRFQIAFAVIGVVMWMAFFSGERISRRAINIALVSCGVLAMVGLGTVVDRWGYGQWTIVPWNYFHKDIVEGRPNLDSTDPIWGYFVKLLSTPLLPITLLWTAVMLATWIRFPRHLVTWGTAPFFVVHSIVPHKELRYLFPMALLGTFAFALAVAPKSSRPWPAWMARFWQMRTRWPAKMLAVINVAALAYACFVAREPSLNFQRYLIDHYPSGCTLFVLGDQTRSPFENVGATMYFHRPANFVVRRVHDEHELATKLSSCDGACLVVRDRLGDWPTPGSIDATADLVYRTYPAWVERFNWFNWLSNSKRFALYAVHPEKDGTAADSVAASAQTVR